MIKLIKVYKDSRVMNLGSTTTLGLGIENDNKVDILRFQFDDFVNGIGTLLTDLKDEDEQNVAFPLIRNLEENSYDLIITKELLVNEQLTFQLMISENSEIVWHSKQYELECERSLDVGQGKMPSVVENWLINANLKLAEFQANEDIRIFNENERKDNELQRSINEELRQENEQTRVANETIRNSNENTRINAENERALKENARITNESLRQEHEVTRQNNENVRISNEQQRERNEDVRNENEIEREDYITALKEAVDRGDFDGEQGPIGPVGPKGEQGEKGEQGLQGIQGEPGKSGVYVGSEEPPVEDEANVWINPDDTYDSFEAQNVMFSDGEDLQYKLDHNKLTYDDTEIKRRINDVIDGISDVEDSLHQEISSVEEMSNSAYDLATEAEIIARGKATGHVFETKQEMDTWLADDSHKALLNVGDHLYIKHADDFDHWWDGEQAQELQTQTVDLSEYVNNQKLAIELSNYYLKSEIDEKDKAFATTASLISAINGCEPKMPNSNDYCIQSVLYGGGESGYRKYKNGMLEQWGVTTSGANGEVEYTMHQSHIDTNFSVFVEPRERGNFYHYAVPTANQKFACRIQTRDSQNIAIKFQWRSWGRWK